MSKFKFSIKNLEKELQSGISQGYSFMTCTDYVVKKKNSAFTERSVVLRVDIDFSVKKAEMLLNLFNKLKIKASFFVRLHAPEYNPFSFENYRILKRIVQEGHEVGLHTELTDQKNIWNEDPKECLRKDIKILENMLNIKLKGTASHGGMTGDNNLDFWKENKSEDFGLDYEAYDTEASFDLFNNSRYISDSEWYQWKAYKNGKLMENDSRSFTQHLQDNPPLIYLLIHSDTYFKNHFYE